MKDEKTGEDQVKETTPPEGTKEETPETVSEDELLKSIEELEGKKEEKKEDLPEPTVKAEELKKTVQDTVEEKGSETLKKALDVSETLSEFAGIVGMHVDEALQTLQKSLQGSADRDLAFTRVLTNMQKSIDSLAAKVEAFGEEPGQEKSVNREEVLEKGTGGEKDGEKKQPKPGEVRKQVIVGLQELAKHAKDEHETNAIIRTTATFESTGKISDTDFARAMGAYKKATAQS